MNNTIEKKTWTADKVESILNVYHKELDSDRQLIATYREIHFRKITNFRGKIFASAAVIATILTATIAFSPTDLVNEMAARFMSQYQFAFIILLIIDLIIVGIAELWFAKYISDTRILWFQLQQRYSLAISHINNMKIFLATKVSEIDKVNPEQLDSLILHIPLSLVAYRIEIIKHINEVRKKIILARDIKQLLENPCEKEKCLINNAKTVYPEYKARFEKDNKFLVGLPLDLGSMLDSSDTLTHSGK